MPAIDTRFFWERDFSIDEGFNFERSQPVNHSLHIHVLETIDPAMDGRGAFSSGCSRWKPVEYP
jgi:hypothetical protein